MSACDLFSFDLFTPVCSQQRSRRVALASPHSGRCVAAPMAARSVGLSGTRLLGAIIDLYPYPSIDISIYYTHSVHLHMRKRQLGVNPRLTSIGCDHRSISVSIYSLSIYYTHSHVCILQKPEAERSVGSSGTRHLGAIIDLYPYPSIDISIYYTHTHLHMRKRQRGVNPRLTPTGCDRKNAYLKTMEAARLENSSVARPLGSIIDLDPYPSIYISIYYTQTCILKTGRQLGVNRRLNIGCDHRYISISIYPSIHLLHTHAHYTHMYIKNPEYRSISIYRSIYLSHTHTHIHTHTHTHTHAYYKTIEAVRSVVHWVRT